jgi:hypothetical protein
MLKFIRTLGFLGLAVVPLAVLTLLAFVRGGKGRPVEYSSPKTVEFEAISTATTAKAAVVPVGGVTDDPTGISIVGDPPVDLALPFETAELLADAERAVRSKDSELVTKARRSLDTFAKERLVAVEKLRPGGSDLAAAVKTRVDHLEQHGTWLDNRAAAAKELHAAADALSGGPEIEAEDACLAVLDRLTRRLPAVVDGTSPTEPGDALTAAEAAEASSLRSRATFRRAFFKNRQESTETNASAAILKQRLQAWDELIASIKRSPPDARDSSLADQLAGLRSDTHLRLLEATAMQQSNLEDLFRSVTAWLNAADRANADPAAQQRKAASLVRSWLEKNVVELPALPIEKGLEQGIIIPAGTRKFGYFKQISNTASQYRWWENHKAMANPKLAKGQDSFVLQGAPAEPTYLKISRNYTDSRGKFIASGYMTAAGVQNFINDCRNAHTECLEYRQAHADAAEKIDQAAAGWTDILARSLTVAEELLTVGNAAGAWKLLAPGAGAP